MSEHQTTSNGSYRMELLGANNWMPWKRRMLAVLRDQNLEEYIDKDSKPLLPADSGGPTDEEKGLMKAWNQGDARARTRIELAIGDTKIIVR